MFAAFFQTLAAGEVRERSDAAVDESHATRRPFYDTPLVACCPGLGGAGLTRGLAEGKASALDEL